MLNLNPVFIPLNSLDNEDLKDIRHVFVFSLNYFADNDKKVYKLNEFLLFYYPNLTYNCLDRGFRHHDCCGDYVLKLSLKSLKKYINDPDMSVYYLQNVGNTVQFMIEEEPPM